VLELAEEALDEVSLAVDAAIDGPVGKPAACRGDVRFCAGASDQREQIVGIVTAVGDDMAAFEALQQLGSGPQVVGLAGGKHQADRQAVLVDDSVDLGAQSATRTADGVIFAPFLPPAAC
jgi:hypothetical protein